jgi:hypothetical protein
MEQSFYTIEAVDRRRAIRRKIAAMKMRQDRLCLLYQGFVIDQGVIYSAAEWCKDFIKSLHSKITGRMNPARLPRRADFIKSDRIWHRFNRGNNASRAADIAKHGEESRWWQARASEHRSGDDVRGIRWYLAKWINEGRISRIPGVPLVSGDPRARHARYAD